MRKYRLICMSFDGDYVSDNFEFDTVNDAWEYSNNIGSRWYFYPFHFVVTQTLKTIKDAPFPLEIFNNKRLKTVKNIFKEASQKPETQGMDVEEFVFSL